MMDRTVIGESRVEFRQGFCADAGCQVPLTVRDRYISQL